MPPLASVAAMPGPMVPSPTTAVFILFRLLAIEFAVVVVPEIIDGPLRIDRPPLLLDLGGVGIAVLQSRLRERQLGARGLLQEDAGQAHLLDRPADEADAVIAQEDSVGLAHAL